MAVRIVSKGLSGAALLICFVAILVIAQAPAALAAQPVLKLSVDHSLRLADGYSTAVVTATLKNGVSPVPNTTVNFSINYGGNISVITDSAGNASILVGPYPSTNYYLANITADSYNINTAASTLSASVLFLPRNNLNLIRIPSSGIAAVGSTVAIRAEFYEDEANSIPAVNVPLSFQVYGPDYTLLGIYNGSTNSTGMLTLSFPISMESGDNTILVGNTELGGLMMSTDFMGEGGAVSNIIMSTQPASPIYADGSSGYLLRMWAVDAGGNPVNNQVIDVYKNGDQLYTYSVTTNAYGYAELNLGASSNVHTDLVTANTTNYNGNDTTYVTNSTSVTYQAGSPAYVQVFANPNVVATRNVSTPTGMSDVHNTSILATVYDQWGHALTNQPVTVSIANGNTTLGNITNPTGMSNNDGLYQAQFSLGYTMNDTDMTVGIPIRAASGNLSGTCSVFRTSNSFLTLNSTISPRNNLSVNDTINASVTIKAIGWKMGGSTTKKNNYSIELIFDSSGSMDWMSNTTYPNGYADNGTMTPIQHSYSSISNIYSTDWHLIDTYNNPTKQTIQIMLSSNYRDYANGSVYYEKVVGPSGVGTVYGTNSANENYVMITNAPVGAYKIYGAFDVGSVSTTRYNMMVLNNPVRLGNKTKDMGTAARTAGSNFIDTRYGDQVGIVWFNVSGGVAKSLTVVNNTTRPSFNNTLLSLNANDGTNIGKGIQAARSDFKSSNYISGNKKVAIILSDGWSQYPDTDLQQAQLAAQEGIIIDTIGLGMPDDATLGAIASITGGNYTKVMTDEGLTQAYQIISSQFANNLTDIAATSASLQLITNCSAAWGPDTRYVPGSAIVTFPNGTKAQIEPTIIDNGTYYSLSWNPGTFTLNDSWTVNYKLKVLRAGSIQPITNKSNVAFIDSDGNPQIEMFPNQSLYVPNNGSMANTTSPLWVTLTYPTNGLVIDSPSTHIDWYANYTVAGGNYYTYAQYRKVGDTAWTNLGVKGPYSSNATFSINWNTGLLENGDYETQTGDYDGTYTNQSKISRITIKNQNGQIVLK